MSKSPRPPKDANQTAAALVREATGTGRVNAESLFGDPAMAAGFRDAKEKARFEEIANDPNAIVFDVRSLDISKIFVNGILLGHPKKNS